MDNARAQGPLDHHSMALQGALLTNKATTPHDLRLTPTLTSPKTGRTSVDKHWDLGCLLIGSADCNEKAGHWVHGGDKRGSLPCLLNLCLKLTEYIHQGSTPKLQAISSHRAHT